MSHTVPASFIQQYDAEVKQAYQQRTSLLRGTVRTRTQVGAERIYFPTLGAGAATGKARHAPIPPMGLEHDKKYADMADRYAADYIDDLDQAKINWSIASEYAQAAASALGRDTDAMLLAAMGTTTNTKTLVGLGGSGTTTLTKTLIIKASKELSDKKVPLDRDRFAVIDPNGLSELLEIEGATSSDFTREQLLVTGDKPAFWMGFNWIVVPELPSGVNMMYYHRAAIGHGISRDVTSTVDWIADRDAWLVKSKMSMGACIIDVGGVHKVTAS